MNVACSLNSFGSVTLKCLSYPIGNIIQYLYLYNPICFPNNGAFHLLTPTIFLYPLLLDLHTCICLILVIANTFTICPINSRVFPYFPTSAVRMPACSSGFRWFGGLIEEASCVAQGILGRYFLQNQISHAFSLMFQWFGKAQSLVLPYIVMLNIYWKSMKWAGSHLHPLNFFQFLFFISIKMYNIWI
jgi:hypothetical protein